MLDIRALETSKELEFAQTLISMQELQRNHFSASYSSFSRVSSSIESAMKKSIETSRDVILKDIQKQKSDFANQYEFLASEVEFMDKEVRSILTQG